MEELLEYLVVPVLEFLGFVFIADKRPVARGVTVGCSDLVLLVAILLGVIRLR